MRSCIAKVIANIPQVLYLKLHFETLQELIPIHFLAFGSTISWAVLNRYVHEQDPGGCRQCSHAIGGINDLEDYMVSTALSAKMLCQLFIFRVPRLGSSGSNAFGLVKRCRWTCKSHIRPVPRRCNRPKALIDELEFRGNPLSKLGALAEHLADMDPSKPPPSRKSNGSSRRLERSEGD